ncbi:solute carrier family 22 member 1-like isoform X1 [Bradysia coprophila]|uniref:solute carrier family 22 member 1-like isoform X1 n=2 Tax=Bradysia coprophila TaxID=38358 RepID=UPI00187D94BD|nr:solute carrier family 22 member 1-like isoform X1 [Bradysia coprophila]
MACIVYSAPIPQRVAIHCMDTKALTAIKHPTVVSADDKVFHLSFCDTFADIKDHANRHYGNESYEMPWTVPKSDIVVNNRSNIIPCDLFNFKSGKSVTTYDVVCSRGGFVVVTQGMHLVGIFLSGIVLRYALKVISPKNVMRSAMIVQIICGNIAGLVESFVVHLIFRALAAIGCAAAFGAGSVIFSDITRGRFKQSAVVLFDTFWSIGIVILSFITQYESRWTQLYLVISYPTLIIVVLTIWMPDSPRWLLSHGDIEGTFKLLVHAAECCDLKDNLPANLAFKLKLQAMQLLRHRRQATWLSLWQNTALTSLRVLSTHIAFACFTIMYFGMVLNMRNYGRYQLPTSARFLALSELTGCFVGYLFVSKTKHTFLWSGIFNVFGALTAFCIWFWKSREVEFVDEGILLYFCLILKASVSSSFGILSACGADSLNKDAKAVMMFSSVLCGRLFLLNAPVIVSLAQFYGKYVSLTVFATLGAIGGLCMIAIDSIS